MVTTMRQPTEQPRRGFVFGAGGVLGVAWTVGALEALAEARGIDAREADVLVGTSAGSVVSALLGSGVGVDVMGGHQRGDSGTLVPSDVEYDYDRDQGGSLPPRPKLTLGSPKLIGSTLRRPWAVTPAAAVSAFLPAGRGSLDSVARAVARVSTPQWPAAPRTWIVAMDYDSGRRTVFGRDGSPETPLSEAVRASCSIPGWYQPVRIGARRYVDGGVCSTCSADLLAGEGLDEVFVFAPMAAYVSDRPKDPILILERRWRSIVTRRLTREVRKLEAAGTKVTVLTPGVASLRLMGANLMDPRRRVAVLESARESCLSTLCAGAELDEELAEAELEDEALALRTVV
jgi:NTE family protein